MSVQSLILVIISCAHGAEDLDFRRLPTTPLRKPLREISNTGFTPENVEQRYSKHKMTRDSSMKVFKENQGTSSSAGSQNMSTIHELPTTPRNNSASTPPSENITPVGTPRGHASIPRTPPRFNENATPVGTPLRFSENATPVGTPRVRAGTPRTPLAVGSPAGPRKTGTGMNDPILKINRDLSPEDKTKMNTLFPFLPTAFQTCIGLMISRDEDKVLTGSAAVAFYAHWFLEGQLDSSKPETEGKFDQQGVKRNIIKKPLSVNGIPFEVGDLDFIDVDDSLNDPRFKHEVNNPPQERVGEFGGVWVKMDVKKASKMESMEFEGVKIQSLQRLKNQYLAKKRTEPEKFDNQKIRILELVEQQTTRKVRV